MSRFRRRDEHGTDSAAVKPQRPIADNQEVCSGAGDGHVPQVQLRRVGSRACEHVWDLQRQEDAMPFSIYGGFLEGQLGDLHIPRDDLRSWQPKGRVDVAPLPRKTGRIRTTAPCAKVDIKFTAEQIHVVAKFAGHGPMTTAQAAEVSGLSTPAVRALLSTSSSG